MNVFSRFFWKLLPGAVLILFIAVVGGLTWLSVQPIKMAFAAGGFAWAIPTAAATIVFFLWLDRRLDKGR